MIDLFASPAAPAVRRPVLEVSFGAAPAADWGRALAAVTLELGLAPAVDLAEAVTAPVPRGGGGAGGGGLLGGAAAAVSSAAFALGMGGAPAAGAPETAVGDPAAVALGYTDAGPEPVFTGSVDSVARGIAGRSRVAAANGGAALARLRLNQSFEQRTAGEIVSDLAGRAGVATGGVEDGIDLPFYAVDDRRTAWQHVAGLARKSGLLARFSAAGELELVTPPEGDPVQTFTYGEDVLALEAVESAPLVTGVKAFGEGAAGSQGTDAWSWIVKDPSAVTGGAGAEPWRERTDPALRSADAATAAAEGALAAAGLGNLGGRLLVPGAPAVRPGTLVEIAGTPGGSLDGVFLVRRVRHTLSKQAGFTTLIHFAQAAKAVETGGGLGGLLGGLL